MKANTGNFYDHYFQAYALEFFFQILPWQWFKAQAIAESGLDPAAVSPAGALGVMQLMPGTADYMARKLQISKAPHVPHVNIRMGIAYDRKCWGVWKKESGLERVRFMLGSYNAGVGNILEAQALAERAGLACDRWVSLVSALPEITGRHATETINYVERIERLYTQLNEEAKK
ncbi:MAG: transglycosylase SLT domain-containing protein [Proteobacteria bacterium]|nr:transglycosylase SLT domain-containing protein [Pseudomonadota bacterium]